MIDIRPAQFPDDLAVVQAIFREYVASPSVSLDFQDYEAEFAALPGKYAALRGCLPLAWKADAVVGCAAFREVEPHVRDETRLRPPCRTRRTARPPPHRAVGACQQFRVQGRLQDRSHFHTRALSPQPTLNQGVLRMAAKLHDLVAAHNELQHAFVHTRLPGLHDGSAVLIEDLSTFGLELAVLSNIN